MIPFSNTKHLSDFSREMFCLLLADKPLHDRIIIALILQRIYNPQDRTNNRHQPKNNQEWEPDQDKRKEP